MNDDMWFAPKRFGYGAGLPISWQGWTLTLGFAALAIAGGLWLAPRQPMLFGALLLVASAALLVLTARHTRGGWRWRWGSDV